MSELAKQLRELFGSYSSLEAHTALRAAARIEQLEAFIRGCSVCREEYETQRMRDKE